MTANEMKYAAQIMFEGIDSSNAPSFIDAEWSEILTAAQHAVVLDILDRGLSDNEQARVALQPLVKMFDPGGIASGAAVGTDSVYQNAFVYELDAASAENLWIILNMAVDTIAPSTVQTHIPVRPITFDFYEKNRNNPFRKPDIDEEFWSLYEADTAGDRVITIITNGENLNPDMLRIQYIDNIGKDIYKITPHVSAQVDCILHSSIHRDIVSKAAALAHLYVGDPQGFQLQTTENKNPGMFYLFK